MYICVYSVLAYFDFLSDIDGTNSHNKEIKNAN
jgi:hypothetical protein